MFRCVFTLAAESHCRCWAWCLAAGLALHRLGLLADRLGLLARLRLHLLGLHEGRQRSSVTPFPALQQPLPGDGLPFFVGEWLL